LLKTKTKSKVEKRGQFYLMAAVIVIVIIIGFATVTNFVRKGSFERTKVFDISKELEIESGKVLDYGTYTGEDLPNLLDHFTAVYTSYTGEDKDLHFIVGNPNSNNPEKKLRLLSYTEDLAGTINVNIEGGRFYNVKIRNKMLVEDPCEGKESKEIDCYRPDESSKEVVVDIEGNEYNFKLQPGENFYFIITQEIEGEQFVVKSDE
jgi:hypothetical protein